jgi:hypothetical protein
MARYVKGRGLTIVDDLYGANADSRDTLDLRQDQEMVGPSHTTARHPPARVPS